MECVCRKEMRRVGRSCVELGGDVESVSVGRRCLEEGGNV